MAIAIIDSNGYNQQKEGFYSLGGVMKFTKMHGAGNDFIILNNMVEKIPVSELGSLAKSLCNRRLSIGADGLMAVDFPEKDCDIKMRFYNADGSQGEMCGNGARCIARYAWENKLAGETQKIDTPSGIIYGWRLDSHLYKIQLPDITVMNPNCHITVLNREIQYAYVELGEPGLPHITVKVEGLRFAETNELLELARTLRYHAAFFKGTNVNFYEVIGENQARIVTYERGVEDFTLACGTGAGATAAVLTHGGKVSGDNTKINVPGGDLFVTVVKKGGRVRELYLTGHACLVAEGEVLEYA